MKLIFKKDATYAMATLVLLAQFAALSGVGQQIQMLLLLAGVLLFVATALEAALIRAMGYIVVRRVSSSTLAKSKFFQEPEERVSWRKSYADSAFLFVIAVLANTCATAAQIYGTILIANGVYLDGVFLTFVGCHGLLLLQLQFLAGLLNGSTKPSVRRTLHMVASGYGEAIVQIVIKK